jgi:hypothetical protein
VNHWARELVAMLWCVDWEEWELKGGGGVGEKKKTERLYD